LNSPQSNRTWTGLQALTDSQGRYTIDGIWLRTDGQDTRRFISMANTDGYAPTSSQPLELPRSADETIDFGQIQLAPGHNVRVRVLDVLGSPAVGAVVTPTYDLQPTKRNVTDDHGEVVIHDLPIGKVQLAAMFGHEYANTEVAVREDDKQVVLATVRLRPQFEAESGAPIAHGEPAPPLEIAAWTDGKSRSLENFRGRLVVLYFWNSAEEGCDQELAIIDNLRQRFAEDGVVFLGIHSARETLDEVVAWMKEKDWRLPTGLDKFDASKASVTTTAYGVSVPSFVIIGRDGRIAFNRDAAAGEDGGAQMFRKAAQALNIDLDAEEKKSDEEGCDACVRILEYIQSSAIQNALEN
jgi:peroxiredoxin